ncbi:MAG: hypothetical protein HDS12_00925 [Bacteroides sp.]|nr:hypothetical protein [Bacteroides sp.]
MVALVSILGWYSSSVRNECNELLKVEWLYRLERTQCSNQKSNLTPGEIEAIKALRADPNIPEDATPLLPEGYE